MPFWKRLGSSASLVGSGGLAFHAFHGPEHLFCLLGAGILMLMSIFPGFCRFDRRHFRWWWQRRTRGFDDRELWSLDYTILEFIRPRIKAFAKAKKTGFPSNLLYGEGRVGENYDEYCQKYSGEEKRAHESQAAAEWQELLDKMVRAIELSLRDQGSMNFSDQEKEEWEEGMGLFSKYFFTLWD